MQKTLDYIIDSISSKNKLHAKKIKNNIKNFDEEYYTRADNFFKKYLTILQKDNKTIDYAIDCYLQMIADINYETVQFAKTGEYSSKSFEEVNKRVYSNPEVMKYYVHGILMSQFLWAHHYKIHTFFSKIIKENSNHISRYLEVGGGHGLYASEAIKIIGKQSTFHLVDISQSSLELAKMMIDNDTVSYFHSDIFHFEPCTKYDFITMGEVLEHVEEPGKLLKKLYDLLEDNGKLFITAPTNGPTIDHIYLFKNADEIRNLIASAGYFIEKEYCVYAEDVSPEIAEKYKVSMMFAGILKKK
ncbi:MAG: methyltransferase domain-containing protein [Bacteroidales bacterium]|jgi:2-polyprenyl-3-methyl-5-hydroxy-6-metoxy-1,4-benzoquinol methylase|nr:class I SAM-dependent methyltransferase [Bacteroidales bacterium]MDD4215102.1 methyltransferase domain-containing protein [Bacteroidales bacterium]